LLVVIDLVVVVTPVALVVVVTPVTLAVVVTPVTLAVVVTPVTLAVVMGTVALVVVLGAGVLVVVVRGRRVNHHGKPDPEPDWADDGVVIARITTTMERRTALCIANYDAGTAQRKRNNDRQVGNSAVRFKLAIAFLLSRRSLRPTLQIVMTARGGHI
jgi:hypothetical protein